LQLPLAVVANQGAGIVRSDRQVEEMIHRTGGIAKIRQDVTSWDSVGASDAERAEESRRKNAEGQNRAPARLHVTDAHSDSSVSAYTAVTESARSRRPGVIPSSRIIAIQLRALNRSSDCGTVPS